MIPFCWILNFGLLDSFGFIGVQVKGLNEVMIHSVFLLGMVKKVTLSRVNLRDLQLKKIKFGHESNHLENF